MKLTTPPHKQSTLTIEQLAERTPLSAGITADNPIFVANQDTPGLTSLDGLWSTVMVSAGSELRLMGCEQTPHVSVYLFKGMYVSIPNEHMDHVEGGLGSKLNDEYAQLDDEFQTV